MALSESAGKQGITVGGSPAELIFNRMNTLEQRQEKGKSKFWVSPLLWAPLFALISLGVVFALPPVYQSRSVLLLPSPSSISSLPLGGATSGPTATINGLIKSISMRKAVAQELSIDQKEVESSLQVKVEQPKNQVWIMANHSNPETSTKIVQSALGHLNELSEKVGGAIWGRESDSVKVALEARQEQRRTVLAQLIETQQRAKAPTDLSNPIEATQFQANVKRLDLEIAAKEKEIAALREAATEQAIPPGLLATVDNLRASLIKSELELAIAAKRLGPDHPQRKQLEQKLNALRSQYEREVRIGLEQSRSGLTRPMIDLEVARQVLLVERDAWKEQAQAAPKELIELIRLDGEVKALDAIISGLSLRLQEATLKGEVTDYPWTVLSPPILQEDPVNKDYFMWGLIGAITGLVFSALLQPFNRVNQF